MWNASTGSDEGRAARENECLEKLMAYQSKYIYIHIHTYIHAESVIEGSDEGRAAHENAGLEKLMAYQSKLHQQKIKEFVKNVEVFFLCMYMYMCTSVGHVCVCGCQNCINKRKEFVKFVEVCA